MLRGANGLLVKETIADKLGEILDEQQKVADATAKASPSDKD